MRGMQPSSPFIAAHVLSLLHAAIAKLLLKPTLVPSFLPFPCLHHPIELTFTATSWPSCTPLYTFPKPPYKQSVAASKPCYSNSTKPQVAQGPASARQGTRQAGCTESHIQVAHLAEAPSRQPALTLPSNGPSTRFGMGLGPTMRGPNSSLLPCTSACCRCCASAGLMCMKK